MNTMNTQMIIEIVGYVGSALVLVSFLMTSVFKLRIVNTVGSFIFMVYALIIQSYPTAIMNFCLVIINLRFLWKMRESGKEYELVELEKGDRYLDYLLNKQKSDIDTCFPGLNYDPKEADDIYLVTCSGAPVGLTLTKNLPEEGTGVRELLLDYSWPEYRDFSIGGFMMRNLKEKGAHTLVYRGSTEHHMAYLNKMNFKQQDGYFVKNL